jgi:hypothetical protein
MSVNINLNNVESTNNKSTNVSTDQASNTKYPSVKSVYDWAVSLFTTQTEISTNGMGVVVHGSTANTPRPTNFAQITWIGSVDPDNKATNDIWYETV